MTVRTFDWKPRPRFDPRDWTIETLLGTPHESQYDRVLDAELAALTARVAALEGKPTPPPQPPPPPPPPPPPSSAVHWDVPISLDQGEEGECVGHGWAHFLAANPHPESIGTEILQNPIAERLYERAQHFDGSPPDEQSGASVDGGARAAVEARGITAWHTAVSGITTVADAVIRLGPVVIGTDWLNSMMDPDPNTNVLTVDRRSGIAGGHCLLINGYDPATQHFTLKNSWGAGWGNNGEAQIRSTDLAWLLSQQGEAVTGTKP